MLLWGRRDGERQGGREDVDDRSQCQTGRLIRRKEGWCMCVCVRACACMSAYAMNVNMGV